MKESCYVNGISLYRYRSGDDYDLKNLENDTIWYSDSTSFNDPYDCYISLDEFEIIRKALGFDTIIDAKRALLKVPIKISKELMKNIRETKKSINELKRKFGISCFSTKKNSILMWSHYANFHKGFLLEYDLDEIRNFVDGKGVICPIEYKKTFKKIGTLESSFTDIIIDNFLTKVEDWNYENEWRIIGIKMTGLQKFIPPKKVYLGCKMETGTRKRVKEICKKKHIPIYEMIMDESEYKLNEILYSTR